MWFLMLLRLKILQDFAVGIASSIPSLSYKEFLFSFRISDFTLVQFKNWYILKLFNMIPFSLID